MAENGVETHNAEIHHHEHGTETFLSKTSFSNGNPFLVDLEKSPDHHHQPYVQEQKISAEIPDRQGPVEEPSTTGSGISASSDVLIDFGTTKEPEPEPEAEVKSNLLLGDFDPLQRPCTLEPEQKILGSGAGSDDLMGFMNDGRGDSNPIEVFAAPPPPGPPDEREPEAIQPVLEVNSSNAVNAPGELKIESTVAGDADLIKGEKTVGDFKADDQKAEDAKPEAKKDPGQTKAKEERRLPQAKSSPRPSSTSVEGEKSRNAAAKSADSAAKSIKAPSAKSPITSAPKPAATPSLQSPKKTLRSNSNKDQTDGEKSSLTNSKSTSQTDAKARAISKSRTPSGSGEHSTIKSPSPGSTPRSSVSASIDGGRASTPGVKSAKSKIGSLDNAKHAPGGGNVKIQSQKIDLSNVTSKCGSKDNMQYAPGGGQKKIESRKLEWKVESKVGSMDNAKHKPGGGEKKIENKKLEWNVGSRVGSLENAQHKPGGGDKRIETVKLDFKDKAQPKVGSKDNMDHKAGGGAKKIETKKLNFNETATSKVGSLNSKTKGEGEPSEDGQTEESQPVELAQGQE